jgi:hypothetical protein
MKVTVTFKQRNDHKFEINGHGALYTMNTAITLQGGKS